MADSRSGFLVKLLSVLVQHPVGSLVACEKPHIVNLGPAPLSVTEERGGIPHRMACSVMTDAGHRGGEQMDDATQNISDVDKACFIKS